MKKYLILGISLFYFFSLKADIGSQFREAVYSIDLTQPTADQLQIFDQEGFKNLKNPYRFIPYFYSTPGWCCPNHSITEFGESKSQEFLINEYGNNLKEVPDQFTLESTIQCSYNPENNSFDIVLKIQNTPIMKNPLGKATFLSGKPTAYCETEDGMLVLRWADGTISVYEFFKRALFNQLSLDQLIVLVNLNKVRQKCTKTNWSYAAIHQDWYEIFQTIPKKAVTFMYSPRITVSATSLIYIDVILL